MLAQRATQDIKVVTADGTYTSSDLLRLIEKNPKKGAKVAASATALVADPAVIQGVRGTVLGHHLSDEGEVETSALTGLEEALIYIAIVALGSGFGLGYLKGKEDGLEEGAGGGEAETESSGEGGDAGPTGDDGGDGEGGEEGEGDGGDTEE